jgi:cell division protein FtsI (penicillin-binding protein 3)
VGVMNANTGEILAMANYPKYNPNKFKQYASNDRKISYISDPFEPGSVFKTFTLAAAIESKIADKDTSYYCEEGKFNVGGHVISEAESSKRFEWLTMEEILQHSSNIGTTKIAFDLTFPRLKKFIDSFNLNKKTNIELPAESRGIYIESENVTPLRLSNISFGQGIATTPLQILAGYSVFANGGEYVRPTILKVDGPVNKTRVISKDTADKVTKMLISSFYNGTGDSAKVPHFTIAGKTSTAQKQGASGKYETHIGGFAGFPVGLDNPFVIFVYIDSPKKNGYYGNQTASPVFSKLAEFMLYREKSHSIHAKVDTKTIKQVFDQIKVQDSARAVNSINASEMPNLLGLDKKSVNKLFHEHTYKILHKGHGIVIHQSIHAGTKIGPGTEFTIEYSPPRYE